MNAEVFAEWFRRLGTKVYKTESSYWYHAGMKALQAFPYHWLINPEESELKGVLKKANASLLRYSTPLSAKAGKISYHAVYEESTYGFESLGKWARKNVARGLKYCKVKGISFEQLAKDGYELQIDTLSRQGRKVNLAKQDWERLCLSASDLLGFEAWGAFVQDKLAASVITFQMNDCAYMLYQQCHRNYLKDHVNNALSFTVTSSLVAKPGIRSILYGLHSLDAPASVDEFKFRSGYTAKPVRQRVFLNFQTPGLIDNVIHSGLRMSHAILPGNPIFAKAEGIMRFYREGKMPLEKQNWPDVLLENKDAILAQLAQS